MPTPASSLPVEHLLTLRADLGTRARIPGGPQGSRVIVEVLGGSFEGARLRGTLQLPAGDWITQREDGSMRLDVRQTLATDDGAIVLMTHQGIGQRTESGSSLRTAAMFETGDERYRWLNEVLAIGVGTRVGDQVTYEFYRLL